MALGIVSVSFGGLAFLFLIFCFTIPFVSLVFSVVSLATGFPARFMAKHDLREMEQGIMNPAGASTSRAGSICALVGNILAEIVLAILIAFLMVFILALARH